MSHFTTEQTSSKYVVTLKDEVGAVIPRSSISTFKFTLFSHDKDSNGVAGSIINSRNSTDMMPLTSGDIMMGATDGIVTYIMTPADNQILNSEYGYERHGLIFDVVLTNGKRVVHEDEIIVENKNKVTS